MAIIDHVRTLFLFGGLSEPELRRVADFCTEVHLPRGEHLFLEGDRAPAFFALLSGRIKLYKLSEVGGEQILGVFGARDLVAEAAVFGVGTYPAYARTLEDSRLLRIPRDGFVQLIRDNPDVALKIIQGYAKRLRYFVGLVEKLTLRDLTSRLVRYILENGVNDAGGLHCRLAITKKELAASLGATPEALSRTLRRLKDDKVIEEQRGDIRVLDHPALQAFL